ncbi:hypothetical protein DMH04_51255 [Kibdelosporangium aridum]|uniref:Peptidase inhibitor family I36 n=1 Tax=Kibdelosporangium aridum TaxID=2030 RepID=A0A428YA46_KIBAR|nr:peptidase inhibitor family I36 protein [Kibdelosporangium aridum]RSM64467.1 hypothetical protein DMH04_51255 [Kibdelosporangium aridum]
MRIKAALLAAAAVAGLATVGLATTATTAAAAPCTLNNACLWSNPGFGGYRFNNFYSQSNWGAVNYDGTTVRMWRGDGVATNVSALDNWDSDSRIAVYYNSGYRGPCFTVANFGSASDFRRVRLTDGTNANERMNSHHFNRTCGTVYNF